jgi:hypothetical protein
MNFNYDDYRAAASRRNENAEAMLKTVVVTPAAYSNSVLPGSHSPGCVGGPQLRGDVCVPRDDVGPREGDKHRGRE